MKDWLAEIIDQIALAEYLSKSKLSCAARFALVAVDNSVECMLLVYVEMFKQLVGGHKSGGIAKNVWEQTKRNFQSLLSYVAGAEPALAAHVDEINRFHDLRSDLYHTGLPITITPKRVESYSHLAREVLAILFSIQISDTEWQDRIVAVAGLLSRQDADADVRHDASFTEVNGVVKVISSDLGTTSQGIALIIKGYSLVRGSSPDRDGLYASLRLSGYPGTNDIFRARISDLTRMGWLRKGLLQLSAKGNKELSKSYIFK